MAIDATWGGRQSNCYVDLTDATEFIREAVVASAAWTSATSMIQAAALLEATRDVDSRQYIGERQFAEQFLQFPRTVFGNWPQNAAVVPGGTLTADQYRMFISVQHATCFQALTILRNSGRNYHAEKISQGIKSYSEGVGPLSESYTYQGYVQRLCPESLTLLQPWMESKRVLRG